MQSNINSTYGPANGTCLTLSLKIFVNSRTKYLYHYHMAEFISM